MKYKSAHTKRVASGKAAKTPAAPVKKRAGRPDYVPDDKTRKRVHNMSAAGIPQIRIAEVLGIGTKTLVKYYPKEMDGALEGLADLAVGGLAHALRQKKPWAICFFLKTRFKQYGWSERKELTGADGKPLDLRGLTDEQLATLDAAQRIIDTLGNQGGGAEAPTRVGASGDQAKS